MLVLATVSLLGHDGEWLKLSRGYFLVCNQGPCKTREWRGLCVLFMTSSGKLHHTSSICLDSDQIFAGKHVLGLWCFEQVIKSPANPRQCGADHEVT